MGFKNPGQIQADARLSKRPHHKVSLRWRRGNVSFREACSKESISSGKFGQSLQGATSRCIS